MSRTGKILSAIVLACFVAGAVWGVWWQREQRRLLANAPPLRVLCAENWISPEVLERFAQKEGIPVQHFTYARPSEFLRQMANADGKVDVVCTSSFLLRSLVRSHWLKKADFLSLPNSQTLATDFVHLPYDVNSEYGLPLFWNLYGFFGREDSLDGTFKQTLQAKKVALWGEELNVLHMLNTAGVRIEERLEHEPGKDLESDIRTFIKSVADVLSPRTQAADAEAMLGKWDWVELPLARVAAWLGDKHHFVLPEEGGALETGLVAVGDKSTRPELAMKLVNELVAPEHGMDIHKRLRGGVVHRTFDNVESIPSGQRPQALRKFPLNRLRFPDLNVEALPRFQKIYDENLASERDGK